MMGDEEKRKKADEILARGNEESVDVRRLVRLLRDGCVYRKKRWSGDTHEDLGGSIDESKTDEMMSTAADELERHRDLIKEIWTLAQWDYDTMPEPSRRKFRELVSQMTDEFLA